MNSAQLIVLFSIFGLCLCAAYNPDCVCMALYSPVCGSNGETYSNSCYAHCAGVSVSYKGPCRDNKCICPAVWAPVCGADGNTFSNRCKAFCAGVGVAYNGPCDDDWHP